MQVHCQICRPIGSLIQHKTRETGRNLIRSIDEQKLGSDLGYRFGNVTEFIDFGEDDIAAIHGSAAHLAPIVPQLVDAVYDKLFLYDATRRQFVPRQSGYEGDVPENVEALLMNHEMIEVHKLHPGRYLERLVTKPYDGNMLNDLDLVGKMHTPKSGSKELDNPACSDECSDGIYVGRIDRHDPQPGPRCRNNQSDLASIQQATLTAERSNHPTLSGKRSSDVPQSTVVSPPWLSGRRVACRGFLILSRFASWQALHTSAIADRKH